VSGFAELVGCTAAVQQAPMGGGVATPELALAVADAGGLGSIAVLGTPTDVLEATLRDMTARTAGALAVNFSTEGRDLAAVELAAALVRLVDFFWAQPDRLVVDVVHRAGALVCWQVGSVAEALAAQEAGVDVVALQGTEAGGHVRAEGPLLDLLRAVGDQVRVPVLAAGGIADARGVAAAVNAGASGVRVGTRFVATEESGAHPRYKEALVAAGAGSTAITGAFAGLCPFCATSARHQVLRSCIDALSAFEGSEVATVDLGGGPVSLPPGVAMPPTAGVDGHVEAMAMYAGASVAAIDAVVPAAVVVAALADP
jgi:nitronate monooxygenase